MISKADVVKQIEREIESVNKRGWVKRHWPSHAQSNPKDDILNDLNKQKEEVVKKDPEYFKDFNDVYDVLDKIEDELYGNNS